MLISDPLAKQAVAAVARCREYSAAFKRFEDQARDLQKEGLVGDSTFVEPAAGVPGFGIDYGWKQLRFLWEPVGVDGEMRGRLVLLESRLDEGLSVKWSRVVELMFGTHGSLDESQLPDEEGILTLGNPTDNFAILMRLVLLGLVRAPLR